jgi:hypothetical protein
MEHEGKQVTEKPDGSVITENTDGTWHVTFAKQADGSFKTYYANGTNTITGIEGKIIKKWQD